MGILFQGNRPQAETTLPVQHTDLDRSENLQRKALIEEGFSGQRRGTVADVIASFDHPYG